MKPIPLGNFTISWPCYVPKVADRLMENIMSLSSAKSVVKTSKTAEAPRRTEYELRVSGKGLGEQGTLFPSGQQCGD